MQGDDHRGTLGTVRNATTLLSLLAEGPAYNQLTDLAERSGMSLPTVHRLLRSLALAGLVEQDPGRCATAWGRRSCGCRNATWTGSRRCERCRPTCGTCATPPGRR